MPQTSEWVMIQAIVFYTIPSWQETMLQRQNKQNLVWVGFSLFQTGLIERLLGFSPPGRKKCKTRQMKRKAQVSLSLGIKGKAFWMSLQKEIQERETPRPSSSAGHRPADKWEREVRAMLLLKAFHLCLQNRLYFTTDMLNPLNCNWSENYYSSRILCSLISLSFFIKDQIILFGKN